MKNTPPKASFPRWRFAIAAIAIMTSATALSIWVAQEAFNKTVKAQFISFVEKTNSEIASIISLHHGIAANILTLHSIEGEFAGNLRIYVNEISKSRQDVSFFILPKVTDKQLDAFEQKKRDEGYLNYQVFGSADNYQQEMDVIYFPVSDVKNDRVMSLKHLGRDVYSYLQFFDAINKTIAENRISAAWSHSSVENAHGISLFSPIYDTNAVEQIPAKERMQHVQLLISSELFLEELINNQLKKSIDARTNLTLRLQTQRNAKEWRTSELAQVADEQPLTWLPSIELNQSIRIADKSMQLFLSSKPSLNQLNLVPGFFILLIAGIWVVLIYSSLRHKATQQQQRWEIEQALTDERNQAKATLNSLGEGVITTDNEGRIRFMNPKASEFFSIQWEAGLEVSFRGLFPDELSDELEKIERSLSEAINQGTLVRLHNIRTKTQEGDTLLLDVTFSPLHKSDNLIHGATLVLEDVTHLEEMRQQIERMAKFDHLTGLYNRYEFEHQLKNAILLAHQSGQQHAFCYLDLDQFKVVNDTAGHMAGDQLLRQLASNVFMLNLPDNAVLGRLGGDEFGLILYNTRLAEATEVCHKLINDIRHFIFIWQGKRFQIGVSIGLVLIDQQKLSVEQCLIAADTACYLAKEKGRNRVEYASADNVEISQRHEELTWVERIPRAIENGRMTLFIQRMLPLNKGNRHAEVLVRMRDEKNDMLLPSQFIAAAERYGIMEQIDRWVVNTALTNIAHLHRSGASDTTIFSINLSGQSLASEKFMQFILQQLDEHATLMPFVCFEITETALMSNLSQAMQCMHQIKSKGAALALDDFGSGLSSFAYLRQMPIDYLKIDGAFVKNMHQDAINRAIVANIHQLSRVFNVQTVAEYVENKEIINELRMIGVDFAQGYGIHKPEPWLV